MFLPAFNMQIEVTQRSRLLSQIGYKRDLTAYFWVFKLQGNQNPVENIIIFVTFRNEFLFEQSFEVGIIRFLIVRKLSAVSKIFLKFNWQSFTKLFKGSALLALFSFFKFLC